MKNHIPILEEPRSIDDINPTEFKNVQVFTQKDVAPAHAWTFVQRGMDFNKNLGLQGLYCLHPFNTITIDGDGDVYACICQSWLPISLGKIWEFKSLNDIIRSRKARAIQATILDGSYRYCSSECGLLQDHKDTLDTNFDTKLDSINWINFAIDASCNLTCPSCRKSFKFISEGPEYDKRISIVEHLVKLIQSNTEWLRFTLSGDGDPFASLIYRELLTKLNLKNRPDTQIEIVTNGILLEAHWHKLVNVHKNIERVRISFDAGTPEVYNVTRRGGDWNKLISSSKFLVDWKKQNNSNTIIESNFVVQTTNYRDIPKFIELCLEMNFDIISFQKIVDWGTWSEGSINLFPNHAIWQPEHPEHQEFLKIMSHSLLLGPKINATNLLEYIN
jgi:MoaA/NifB/PqqE/SkfB family radical SAM enzyme